MAAGTGTSSRFVSPAGGRSQENPFLRLLMVSVVKSRGCLSFSSAIL